MFLTQNYTLYCLFKGLAYMLVTQYLFKQVWA